jgi:hypothetical protein
MGMSDFTINEDYVPTCAILTKNPYKPVLLFSKLWAAASGKSSRLLQIRAKDRPRIDVNILDLTRSTFSIHVNTT